MGGQDEQGRRVRLTLPPWFTGSVLTALVAIVLATLRLVWWLGSLDAKVAQLERHSPAPPAMGASK